MKFTIYENVLNEQVVYGGMSQLRAIDEVEGETFEEARQFALARNPYLTSMIIEDDTENRIELDDANIKLDN